ncbi:metallophosphoesterase family protein [Robbsia andropogonis]|uniref:metallophosphoesterase family protein n=1 Tax=Robbsia andropogonis TaxID=28092 RepID=UPI003D2029EC
MLSWVHFGDLHASSDDGFKSLSVLQEMVGLVNRHFSERIDFAYLPGDNANNGTPEQFERIRDALRELNVPLHVIPGDHDFEPGHLGAFQAFANAPLPTSRIVKGHRCLFLDVVSAAGGGPDFRLSAPDRQWLNEELERATHDRGSPVVFMHAYPGDLVDGGSLACAFAYANVAIVDTGHTHYNELLNDGYVIYAATRSTGQIEEDDGYPGFAVVAVDGPAVSWKFHRLDAGFPFVMITQPSDRRMYRKHFGLYATEAKAQVRVLVSNDDVVSVSADLDGVHFALARVADEPGVWQAPLPAVTSMHRRALSVTARTADGRIGQDAIELPGADEADRNPSPPDSLGTDVHAVDAWPEHGIIGSQLGPNKNGHGW